jgi:hypothetical protein
MLTVHVRVNDAATGRPTPVRVRFTGPRGEYLPPFGRLADFATGRNEDVGGNLLLGSERYAYLTGTCEIRLPAGTIAVAVDKGFEFTPLRHEITLGPGQLSVRLSLDRWIDLRQQRWYSGDMRTHFLTPHAALLEAAAEDLAFANLLALEWRPSPQQPLALSNLLAFSGQHPALEVPGHQVVVNTQNVHPILGRLALLNCHRVIYPLSFGGPDGQDDWTLADWCDQCHRKGGLVVWTDILDQPAEYPGGEALADLILGKVDAFEITGFDSPEPELLLEWYRLLNCGFRVPLVGGSGKDRNTVALGSVRTYARLQPGDEVTYRNWIEAVRAGRTFATNGPLISFSVDGQDPGARIVLPYPGKTVRVSIGARSLAAFDQLELIQNGTVLAATPATGSPAEATLAAEVAVSADCWLAARCWSRHRLAGGQLVYGHTSPVYLQVEGAVRRDAAAVVPLLGRLNRMLAWVERDARVASDERRHRLAAIFRGARDELMKRAEGVGSQGG